MVTETYFLEGLWTYRNGMTFQVGLEIGSSAPNQHKLVYKYISITYTSILIYVGVPAEMILSIDSQQGPMQLHEILD